MNPETINSHRSSFAYRFSQILLGLILCATVVSGCQTPPPPETAPVEGTTYEIAPVFREFHTALGGEAVLGPAISQLFPFQELECQYTLNALMCQNPLLSGSERFMLYPLGKAFDLKPSEAEKNKDSSARVVNGITIYEDFVPLFDKLSGEQYAGNPITGANINYKQKRIEQYFESVGIYRMMDDSAGEARLLAYGAYACDQKCSYPAHAEAMLYDPAETILEQPFKARLDELGIGSAFGVPLTQPYITEDGALEQVYSNVVIYRPAGETDKIRLNWVLRLKSLSRKVTKRIKRSFFMPLRMAKVTTFLPGWINSSPTMAVENSPAIRSQNRQRSRQEPSSSVLPIIACSTSRGLKKANRCNWLPWVYSTWR